MSEPTGREKAHDEFVRPGALPEGANLPDAEARLLKALEQELGVPLESDRPPLRIVRPNRMKPLLAFAAVVAATAGLVWSLGSLKGGGPVMRGRADQGAWTADAHATQLDARRTRLSWRAARGATSYTLVFLSSDLSEIARVDDVTQATYVLDRDALPAGLVSNQSVLWRVTANASGDELSRSSTSPLQVP